MPVPWKAEGEALHGDDATAGAAVDVGRGEEERLRNFSLGVAMAGVRGRDLLFRRMCSVSTGSFQGKAFEELALPISPSLKPVWCLNR